MRDTISFRLDSGKRAALDAVASVLDTDRSHVLNEAIDAYLEAHRQRIEHIREGLQQANAGQFATESEMKGVFGRCRK